MKPSASNLHLLFACPRPFSDDVEVERDEPNIRMRYGSAFHEMMAGVNPEDAAAKFNVVPYTDELAAHVVRAKAALNDWLENNYLGVKFTVIAEERAAAWDYVTRTSRHNIPFNEAEHSYDCAETEIPGTADLVVHAEGPNPGEVIRVVFDYKTGDYGSFDHPELMPQMQHLAVTWDATHVAILHAPRGGIPVIHIAPFDSMARAKAEAAMTAAMLRINSGFLRPGPHCKRCPAKVGCPTNNADLIKETNMLVRMATGGGPLANPVDKGALSQFLRLFSPLAEQARELLKADVKAGEVITEPSGKTLQMQTAQVERISKKSIIEALGKEAGEAKLAELRALGCLVSKEEEKMVAK